MAYTISSILAIYFVLWWVVLFVTLPFGIRTQSEGDETIPGTEPGAPIATMMARKLIWTTVLSAVIFAVAFLFYWLGFFRIDRLTELMGLSHWSTRSY
jgi:predicted secreted protein